MLLGLDNINDYYDVNLKYARLKALGVERSAAEPFGVLSESIIHNTQLQFIRLNLEDRENLPQLFKSIKFDLVCNLAAQAGVRYSLENPEVYNDSNVTGFLNVLECCRQYKIKRLVYGSSSSVYGNTDSVPFKETAVVDQPISLYAATKKANELMALHLQSFIWHGNHRLTFFYGVWSGGRPDMAMFLFTDAIINNRPLKYLIMGSYQEILPISMILLMGWLIHF